MNNFLEVRTYYEDYNGIMEEHSIMTININSIISFYPYHREGYTGISLSNNENEDLYVKYTYEAFKVLLKLHNTKLYKIITT